MWNFVADDTPPTHKVPRAEELEDGLVGQQPDESRNRMMCKWTRETRVDLVPCPKGPVAVADDTPPTHGELEETGSKIERMSTSYLPTMRISSEDICTRVLLSQTHHRNGLKFNVN